MRPISLSARLNYLTLNYSLLDFKGYTKELGMFDSTEIWPKEMSDYVAEENLLFGQIVELGSADDKVKLPDKFPIGAVMKDRALADPFVKKDDTARVMLKGWMRVLKFWKVDIKRGTWLESTRDGVLIPTKDKKFNLDCFGQCTRTKGADAEVYSLVEVVRWV